MAQQSQITGAIGGAAQGAKIGSSFGGFGAAIGGVIGGISGFLMGGGEDEAQELAEMQAASIRLSGRQAVSALRQQQGQVVGMARAQIGGANIQFSGSARRYTRNLGESFSKEIGWENARTRMAENIAMMGGDAAAAQIRRAGVGSMLSGLGTVGDTYNNLKT
jgi:hypothetical protein